MWFSANPLCFSGELYSDHCKEHQLWSRFNLFCLFVCQDPEQLQDSANHILTAIIQGMRKEEPSNNVKLAATNALLNSLEFTKANFDKEVQSAPSDSFTSPPRTLTALTEPGVSLQIQTTNQRSSRTTLFFCNDLSCLAEEMQKNKTTSKL